jgi:uncharacterized protein (DUF4415 family)
MKKRKGVTKRRKIGRLQASTDGQDVPPELLQSWRGYFRPIKKLVTLRLDADVLAWFKKPGPGYQTRINGTLRKAIAEERKKSEG